MSEQRPGDTILHQREIEGVINERLGPTDVAVFGDDIELLNGFAVPPVGDDDFAARVYKQAGRAWIDGVVWTVTGGEGLDIVEFPETYEPDLTGMGVAQDDWYMQYIVPREQGGNFSIVQLRYGNFGAGPLVLRAVWGFPNTGDYLYFHGISWPVAS